MHKKHKGYSEKPTESCNNHGIFPEADHVHNKKTEYSSNHNGYVVIKISSKLRKSRTYQNGYLTYCSHCREVQMHIKLDILMEKPDIKQKCCETILQ